jgi:hypothetical protein
VVFKLDDASREFGSAEISGEILSGSKRRRSSVKRHDAILPGLPSITLTMM